MAMGVLRALHEAGIRVPEDIGLAGFDDLPSASGAHPRLTTMRQPIHKLGSTAAEKIIERIHTPSEQPLQIILPVELVERQSSARLG
jgi:LacI family transcriptional regulator